MKDIIKWLVYGGLFAVPCLTLLVANEYFFPYITGKNFWFRIIVEVVLAGYIILALLDKNYRPKFSWIVVAFLGLISTMLVSTINAEHIQTAFWSNFERMDGYITLLHVFIYFFVLGSVLKTKTEWLIYFHISIAVAFIVAFIGLVQLSSGTTRVDSRLGNAAYMAVYMLFHLFFLAYLFVTVKVAPYRVIYALLALMFLYVLLQTGTRGTAIGLVAGSITAGLYALVYARSHPTIRRYALFSCAALVVVFGSFYALRDSSTIQNTPALARIANINLEEDLRVRSIIWSMSIEGIKERPLFGWGNGNFNYVFNEQYDPRLYGQEQWFDRVHNIVFDWLIAGGVFGFVAYVSIFFSLAYYLLWRPWWGDQSFSVAEGAILSGLVIGYLTHNLVVFDNIVSYIFFAALLGLIHSRVGLPISYFEKLKVPEILVRQVVAPVVFVCLGSAIYFLQMPNMYAAGAIIDAYREQDLEERLAIFESILASRTFARQEIVEQLAQQAMGIATSQDPALTPEIKEKFLSAAERELQNLVAYKPNDARVQVFLASYYRTIGDNKKAEEALKNARALSPNKQSIILQQGAVSLAENKNDVALAFFKEAFLLDELNPEAREYYVTLLYITGSSEEAKVITREGNQEFQDRIVNSDFYLSGANTAKDFESIASIYEKRVNNDSTIAQNWASLAYTYYQLKDINKAISTLEKGALAVPSFASTSRCVIGNLKAGKSPETACQ